MQSYLQMQDLWAVTSGEYAMPIEPKLTVSRTGAATVTTPVDPAALAAYRAAFPVWKKESDKALGALTLRLAPQLRHYQGYGENTTWAALYNAFGAPSKSAIFADFKQVVTFKLSGGNPVPEIEHVATLFSCLQDNNFAMAHVRGHSSHPS